MVTASPTKHLDSISKIVDLIATDDFTQAADYLQQIQPEASSDVTLNQLITSARCLCLASAQNRQNLEWHRKAADEAHTHQADLTAQLYKLLTTINELVAGEMVSPLPITTPSAEHPTIITDTRTPTAHTAVRWQGLRSLFKRDSQELTAVNPKPESNGWHVQVDAPPLSQDRPISNSLVFYTLGAFQVYRNDELVDNLPSRKGILILKYLTLNRERPIHKEVLMDLFWGDSEEEAQRNNLNVAIYSLRQALRNGDPSFSHILFQNDCYFLNPELTLWADYEMFMEYYQTGRRHEQQGQNAEAVRAYEMAETLYQGVFLPEDQYEEWTENTRQSLQSAYLSLLDCLSRYYLEHGDYAGCIAACNKMLAVDSCFEEAHVRLMCCYSRQGQTQLALRQYDRCVRALEAELDVPPMPETEALYERLRIGGRL